MDASSEKHGISASPAGVPSTGFTAASVRRCESCLIQHPLQQFRRRYRDGEARMRQCHGCHNRAERVRRAVRRDRLNRRQMAKLLTATKNQRSDLGVKALCREMVGRFGGVDGIVEHWHHSLDTDLAKGGYAAFRHLAAILRLSQYCEQNRPDYGAMSEEALEAEIRILGSRVLAT